MTTKDKTIKSISALLIISILLPFLVAFYNPKKTEATGIPVVDAALIAVLSPPTWMSKALHAIGVPSTVLNTTTTIKKFAQEVLQRILMTVAKAFLAKMTQATINWINSDFHGSPLFIENPGAFFKDIAKSEVRRLVDMIGYDTFRFPFGKQTALNVISSFKSQLATNAEYSLSRVINDPDLLRQYRNDFNYGGWNGFLINTQYPQNNYLGFEGMIRQNLASRLEGTLVAPAQKIQNLLQQGMGFLSPQTCPSNPKYNNGTNEFVKPSFKSTVEYIPPADEPANTYLERDRAAKVTYQNAKDAEKATYIETNTCPDGLVNTTPGSVAANQIMTAMSSSYRQSELAMALGNSLSAIFDALINHFMDKGLNALSNVISPPPSDDNWSYDGNALSSTYSASATNGIEALKIPQNVSATVGQTTSTMIFGGKAPYTIEPKPVAGIASAQISVAGSSYPKLTVTGVTPGQTFLVVKDSSSPVQTARVDIAINAIGALTVNPHDISTNLSNPISATISGGKEPYNLRIRQNEAIATVAFDGANLVVSGVERGNTFIVIEDSSDPIKKTTTVQITINSPEDLILPQNITANVGQVTNIAISGGTAPYIITDQMDVRVATGQVSNPTTNTPATLIVTGITAGETAIVIKDSSSPIKITNTNITVIDNRTLIVTPQNVSANIDQITSINVSGGTGIYSIDPPLDQKIATAQILGSNVIVTGKATGQTSMIVKDSATPPKTVTIPITIGALVVNPQNVSTSVGQTTSITISGGTGIYSIETQPDTTVATAQILNLNIDTITITGKRKGQTGMIIKDSSNPPKTTGIQITVN